MSIPIQIERLETAKTDIKAAIQGKGVTVPDGTKIDGMAGLLNSAAYVVNVSADTVTADTLAEGVTAHDAAGNAITGTMAVGGGVEINVITASSLPATVVDNQIVVITSTTPNTIYVDTNEPTAPASGDVWVVVAEGDYGINFTEDAPYFSTKFSAAEQYNGISWAWLDGYIGVSGVWQQFARRGLPAMGTPLEQWTWEQIVILANSGKDVTQYFAIGDQKNLVLTTGEVVPVVIGDFNHNTITNSGGAKAPIAFTFKNCLNTTYAINDSATNSGGWDGSNMRKTHMVNIFNTFPAELRAEGAIKYVDVAATAGGKSPSLVTSSDRLRIHSATELGLTYSEAGTEGTTYAYYAAGNRVKTINGTESLYWTRSPRTNSNFHFCIISLSGDATGANANLAIGVACGFDI